ncbi:rCG31010 [Rattus norvegicus]|uniref:RCG31010 n=1 Tax=Rattus norvegicus TaxID=10116 RepID=A6ISQ2_RAT|nr:rCG31010 [Rattus norvegicus]
MSKHNRQYRQSGWGMRIVDCCQSPVVSASRPPPPVLREESPAGI